MLLSLLLYFNLENKVFVSFLLHFSLLFVAKHASKTVFMSVMCTVIAGQIEKCILEYF